MAKIIDIHDDWVIIGLDNGKIQQVLKEEVRFKPHIGDEVEIYSDQHQDLVYVLKKGDHLSDSDHQQTTSTHFIKYPPAGKCNRIVYLVVCALFGMFGFHWFVANNNKRGIAYLLFCWTLIPAFLAMADFAKGCVMPGDYHGRINPSLPLTHHKVNKVLYLLITFFFGIFGFQKYYSGDAAKGNLCFAFFWTGIPLIISFIDFFSALFMTPDIHGRIDKH